MLRTIARACAVLLVASSLRAQVTPPPVQPLRDPMHAPGSELTVTLLTMGTGTEVWEMFGHTAIWVHDDLTGRDTVFNWGEFDRNAPNFIPRFLKGLMLYTMGGQRMGDLLYAYRYWNRSVTAQELNLTAAEKDSLVSIIQVNARPENVRYRYDYFIDNCATRPRDILDRVLGGQLRVGADSLTTTSYRWHALRQMQGDKPLVLGVDIGLGEPSDRPITRWQTMFLPQYLHDWVATRQVRDSTGATRPLVKSERVLFQANRPPMPAGPPGFGWLWFAGLVLGAGFAGLGVMTARGKARTLTASVFGVWAAVCGVLGLLLTLLWTVTDHRFAHANENLLVFNPLWLVVAFALPMAMRSGRASATALRAMWVIVGLGLIGLLSHAVGLSRQDNLPVLALGLLPSLGILAALQMRRSSFDILRVS